MTEHVCVDCRALPPLPDGPIGSVDIEAVEYRPRTPRPAPHGGPRSRRCTTHRRSHKAATQARSRAAHKTEWFGLDAELQQTLWAFQGGRCPCGAKRAAALPSGVHTDHDHDLAAAHDHPDGRGCPECVTGYLCAACNREIVGRLTGRHGRAGAAVALRRLADFLDDPPMARLRRAGVAA